MFNKKTLKLYKDRWNIGSRGNTPSHTGTKESFELQALKSTSTDPKTISV